MSAKIYRWEFKQLHKGRDSLYSTLQTALRFFIQSADSKHHETMLAERGRDMIVNQFKCVKNKEESDSVCVWFNCDGDISVPEQNQWNLQQNYADCDSPKSFILLVLPIDLISLLVAVWSGLNVCLAGWLLSQHFAQTHHQTTTGWWRKCRAEQEVQEKQKKMRINTEKHPDNLSYTAQNRFLIRIFSKNHTRNRETRAISLEMFILLTY